MNPENKNTSPEVGNPENTAAWSRRAIKHLPAEMFQKAGIIGPGNHEWRNVANHSLVVNATALFMAEALKNTGADINIKLVDDGSILHDVTKRIEKEQGVSYHNEHDSDVRRNFLAENFPSKSEDGHLPAVIAATEYTGRVPEMFIEDETQRLQAISEKPLEQLVVAYADARVRDTNIFPLEEARDLNKEKVPQDAAVYDKWYTFYKEVEDRIFSSLGDSMAPEDISNDTVSDFVVASQNY